MIAGGTTLASLWVLSMATAAGGTSDNAMSPLFVPVIGPFIAIGTHDGSAVGTAALAADGIGQLAGALLLAFGARNPIPFWKRAPSPLQLTPISLGGARIGAGVSGTL